MAYRALKLRSNDPDILEMIAQSYTRQMSWADSSEQRWRVAEEALAAWEACVAAKPNALGARWRLGQLAISAFEAHNFKKANQYANELLSPDRPGVGGLSQDVPDAGADAIHDANTVLGRIALRKGNVEEAKRRLMASVPEHGSTRLESYGPRMILAAELLDRGERKAVIEYLDRCTRFGKPGTDKLNRWKRDIRAGKNPDFGDSLRLQVLPTL